MIILNCNIEYFINTDKVITHLKKLNIVKTRILLLPIGGCQRYICFLSDTCAKISIGLL